MQITTVLSNEPKHPGYMRLQGEAEQRNNEGREGRRKALCV